MRLPKKLFLSGHNCHSTLLYPVSLLIGWSIQRANGQFWDHIVGQLTIIVMTWGSQLSVRSTSVLQGLHRSWVIDSWISMHISWIWRRNIARGTTDPGYWVFNLNYHVDRIEVVSILDNIATLPWIALLALSVSIEFMIELHKDKYANFRVMWMTCVRHRMWHRCDRGVSKSLPPVPAFIRVNLEQVCSEKCDQADLCNPSIGDELPKTSSIWSFIQGPCNEYPFSVEKEKWTHSQCRNKKLPRVKFFRTKCSKNSVFSSWTGFQPAINLISVCDNLVKKVPGHELR